MVVDVEVVDGIDVDASTEVRTAGSESPPRKPNTPTISAPHPINASAPINATPVRARFGVGSAMSVVGAPRVHCNDANTPAVNVSGHTA